MTATPEHDKIDELRKANPLATNLLHLLLSVPGWVIVNDIVEPPVQVPVSRIAAALLGVDAVAYRAETEARFGLDDVPAGIAETVIGWSEEDAVLEELRELAELAAERASLTFDAAVAESPIAAAAGVGNLLASDTTRFATPDPEVPANLRGTLAGAAIAAGVLDAAEAADHPAAAVPLDGSQWPLSTNTEQFLGQPAPFTVPAPQTEPQPVAFYPTSGPAWPQPFSFQPGTGPSDALPVGLFAPGSAPLVPDTAAPANPFDAPAPLPLGIPAGPSPFDRIIAPFPGDGIPAPFPGDGVPAPFPGDGFPMPSFDLPIAPAAEADADVDASYEPADRPEIIDPFAAEAAPAEELPGDAVWYDSADDADYLDTEPVDTEPAGPDVVDPFDVPYTGRILEGSGDLADANDDDDEQLIYPGYEPKDAPLA